MYQGDASTREFNDIDQMIERLVEIGEPAVPKLIDTLSNSNWDVRKVSYQALCGIGKAAVKPLKTALDDTNWRIRRVSAEALGTIGDADAVDNLARLLCDEEPSVRNTAGNALVMIGGPAIDLLISFLSHRTELYRIQSARALGLSRDKSAVLPLIDALLNPDELSWDVLTATATALGELGDARAVQPLLDVLEEEDTSGYLVTVSIVKALGELRDKRAVVALINHLRSEHSAVQIAVIRALRCIGDVSAEQALIKMIYKPDVELEVRRCAIRGLGELKGESSLECLVDLATHENRVLRLASARALGDLGDKAALDTLFNLFRDEDRTVREATVEALGKLKDARSVEPLIISLKDERWWIRGNSAVALGSLHHHCDRWWEKMDADEVRMLMGHECAIPALIESLRDENAEVVYSAANSLINLTDEDFGQDPELWADWWTTQQFGA